MAKLKNDTWTLLCDHRDDSGKRCGNWALLYWRTPDNRYLAYCKTCSGAASMLLFATEPPERAREGWVQIGHRTYMLHNPDRKPD